MLSDRGLTTPEYREQHAKFLKERFEFGSTAHGCIDKAICSQCKHLIVDSLCLCSGAFKCPNCGHENGAVELISWPTLEGRLSQPIVTELEALQQLERCVPLSEEGKSRLRKLLDKLPTTA